MIGRLWITDKQRESPLRDSRYFIQGYRHILLASDGQAGDAFGLSVATTGETVLVGAPYAYSWLVYSMAGPGSTPFPPLNIVIELTGPKLGACPKMTNKQGDVEWTMIVPPPSAGRDIWFQVIQDGLVTNVVATSVQ